MCRALLRTASLQRQSDQGFSLVRRCTVLPGGRGGGAAGARQGVLPARWAGLGFPAAHPRHPAGLSAAFPSTAGSAAFLSVRMAHGRWGRQEVESY